MTSTPSSLPNPEHDEVGKKLLATTDAEVWAAEFCRIFKGWTIVPEAGATVPGVPTPTGIVDEGGMLAWFASAIETGRNAGRKELCPHTDPIQLGDDIYCCRDCGFLMQPVDLGDEFVKGFEEGR